MSAMQIRLATAEDFPAINAIYTHYILNTTVTYHLEPLAAEERRAWFAEHGPLYPMTVAEEAGEVLAWASLSPFRPRPAYRHTVEDSVYVRQDLRGRGIGSRLMEDLLMRAVDGGHHSVMAVIDSGQPASIKLHARYGFAEVGRLREVGFKFDQWLDIVMMQLMLPGGRR
jgi:L-amino acid N-acyltransferase YncA